MLTISFLIVTIYLKLWHRRLKNAAPSSTTDVQYWCKNVLFNVILWSLLVYRNIINLCPLKLAIIPVNCMENWAMFAIFLNDC